MPVLPGYEETVGQTRAYAESSDGSQPGDPAKAAKAIVLAVNAGAPNLRLPLGADATKSIREKLAQIMSDVNATEKVAADTAY